MEWLVANWFWALIFIAFIALHLFGHGGHGGGHHHQWRRDERDEGDKREEARRRFDEGRSSGHQH